VAKRPSDSAVSKRAAAPAPESEPRKRRRRKEARPTEIIEAGFQVFAVHGYAGARLGDVAERAGVVKGTIYRYFEDKQSLFLAVVRSKVPVIGEVSALIDGFEGTTRELLLGLLHLIYAKVVDSDVPVLMRIIITEGPKFPELVRLYHRETIAKVRPLLEKIVARGVARGEIHADHARLLPLMIPAPAIMACMWRMTFDAFDPVDTHDFLEAHVELLCRGLLMPA
jgi:AcrR family transcriptional regulator